ncbi:MAG: hypothetical protein LBC61_06320 [Candidatus Peribacteria bacterium]|nr:hypothetical protein [Candidatus Peribacteria bacterium]
MRPIDDDWQTKSTRASSKILSGKSPTFSLNPLKLILSFIEAFSIKEDQKTPQDSNTSALTQERAKMVDEK